MTTVVSSSRRKATSGRHKASGGSKNETKQKSSKSDSIPFYTTGRMPVDARQHDCFVGIPYCRLFQSRTRTGSLGLYYLTVLSTAVYTPLDVHGKDPDEEDVCKYMTWVLGLASETSRLVEEKKGVVYRATAQGNHGASFQLFGFACSSPSFEFMRWGYQMVWVMRSHLIRELATQLQLLGINDLAAAVTSVKTSVKDGDFMTQNLLSAPHAVKRAATVSSLIYRFHEIARDEPKLKDVSNEAHVAQLNRILSKTTLWTHAMFLAALAQLLSMTLEMVKYVQTFATSTATVKETMSKLWEDSILRFVVACDYVTNAIDPKRAVDTTMLLSESDVDGRDFFKKTSSVLLTTTTKQSEMLAGRYSAEVSVLFAALLKSLEPLRNIALGLHFMSASDLGSAVWCFKFKDVADSVRLACVPKYTQLTGMATDPQTDVHKLQAKAAAYKLPTISNGTRNYPWIAINSADLLQASDLPVFELATSIDTVHVVEQDKPRGKYARPVNGSDEDDDNEDREVSEYEEEEDL
jgi:hypothetical protein